MVKILLIAIGTSLWEELTFRGLLQWLTSKLTKNKWLIILPQSLIFSALHALSGGITWQLLYSLVFAIIFGLIVYNKGYKKGLLITILLHFLVNAIGLSYGVYVEGMSIEEIITTA